MVDCLLSLVFDEPMDCYEALGLPERLGNRIMRLSPFNAYQARDGWLVIGSGTDAHWNNILRAVGREELVGDARYADLSGRITHNDEVDAVHYRMDGKTHRGGCARSALYAVSTSSVGRCTPSRTFSRGRT